MIEPYTITVQNIIYYYIIRGCPNYGACTVSCMIKNVLLKIYASTVGKPYDRGRTPCCQRRIWYMVYSARCTGDEIMKIECIEPLCRKRNRNSQ